MLPTKKHTLYSVKGLKLKVIKELDRSEFYDMYFEYFTGYADDEVMRELFDGIYDFLEDYVYDVEDITDTQIKDILRYDIMVESEEEIRFNYSDTINEEFEDMEDFLSYNTTVYATYEDEDGMMWYAFGEF